MFLLLRWGHNYFYFSINFKHFRRHREYFCVILKIGRRIRGIARTDLKDRKWMRYGTE